MSITTDQLQSLGSAKVFAGSDKIGSMGEVYLDDTTGEPTWVTVKTGLFGTSETFVPLEGARVDGGDVVVAYDEATVKGAPRVDADGSLSPTEEDELYRYYGLSDAGQGTTTDDTSYDAVGTTGTDTGYTTTDATDSGDTRNADVPLGGGGRTETNTDTTVGHDTSGPTTDDAMTISEERVNVGTATRESGRARLRKYVSTETVTETVPVSHEKATLEREPITDANVGAAHDGPAISEEEHEVVLHEEVPVVDKDVVATERVKLGTETVTEDATVSEDVRKENVELVDPDTTSTDR